MKRTLWLALLILAVLPLERASASWRKDSSALAKANKRIQGRVIDYTANHGADHRMWSRSLGQRRDLYVYVPAGYERCQRYPFMIFMHGFAADEQSFLDVVPHIDDAICQGKMPPMIIAVPDGTVKGEPSCHQPGTFFVNSEAGSFEDFILQDVWDFVTHKYLIREEREAHVLAGVSMGGFAAYNFGIRHRKTFGTVVGIYPPLNTRWLGADGNYFDDFDPRFWNWRNTLEPRDVIARAGLFRIKLGDLVGPLYGVSDQAIAGLSRENPIELVDRTHLRDGQLAMYVGYGGKDEFNIDAQVESFLYLCKFRGITVSVGYDPDGRHNACTAMRLLPGVFEFLSRHVGPYAPGATGLCDEGVCLPAGR